MTEKLEEVINVTAIGLHQLFDQQAERTPDAPAILLEDRITSYAELANMTDRIANTLAAYTQESIVAVYQDKSPEMVASLLGIMKVDKAYLPLDLEYPALRIADIMKESKVSLIITSKGVDIGPLADLPLTFLYVEDLLSSNDQIDLSMKKSQELLCDNQLAYVIYTSGSTGTPKGVMIEHRSIVNTIQWRMNYYRYQAEFRVLQIPSVAFDSSVEDIFTALLSGAALVMFRQRDRLNIGHLKKLIKNHEVTHFLITPELYKLLIENPGDSFESVRAVTLAGEYFTKHLVSAHFQSFPHVRLFNEYGPSENSVCTTVYEFDPHNIQLLIGMPIRNVKCAILHEGGFMAEVGEEGELLTAGVGLARGYLNQPVLTDERFQDVFQTGERWYRTGDLVKLNQDGNMEFLGRLDRQIKVRGFRVELAEIDNAIMQQEQVQNAYSTLIEDNGNKLIYSYVVAKDDDLHQDKIMAMLRDKLPDYMIPSHVIQVPNIPLTTNGKIAVDQLPKPSCPSGVEEGAAYTAGSDRISNQLNEALVQIIGSKTNIGQIDPDDNLKHHGLDSLSMIKFLVMLEELFEIEIDYFDLDELQPLTISKLRAFLVNKQE